MEKKFIVTALILAMLAMLITGCGKKDKDSAVTESIAPTEDAAESPEATEAPSETPEATEAPAETPKATEAPDETEKPEATPAPTNAPAATEKPTQQPAATEAPAAEVSVQDIWAAFEKELGDEMPNFADVDDSLLEPFYAIAAEDMVEYVGKMPLMNVKATEVFIAKAASGKLDTVKAGCEFRHETLDSIWSHYLPDQYELVENYKLITKGDYVLFVVAEKADKLVEIFDGMVQG